MTPYHPWRGSEELSTDAWTGHTLFSFRVSDELAQMVDLVARHEHRKRSELIRRAVMQYMAEEGYFERPQLDIDRSVVEEMVTQARRELDDRQG